MKVMFRTVQVVVLLAASLLGGCDQIAPKVAPPVALTGKVKEVVDRSKTTRTTYAMYSWNEISRDGKSVQEWGAEFHAGDKHRVETPRDRLIADCAAMTGSAYSLETGETVDNPAIALGACGINTNKAFTAAEWEGQVKTPFGAADRVRLTDKDNIRTYDISPSGVILRSTYAKNDAKASLELSSEAVSVLDELPAPDMFDKASLSKSYVPDHFKIAPGTPPAPTSPH